PSARKEPSDILYNEVHAAIHPSVHALQDLFGPQVHVKLRLQAQDPWVKTDSLRLEHVLLQLATNARDAMPDGGRFMIETIDDGPDVRLSIQDSGTGMEPATLERAFEPFF